MLSKETLTTNKDTYILCLFDPLERNTARKSLPVLHLRNRVIDIFLFFLQLGHIGLNDFFMILEGFFQKLVAEGRRTTSHHHAQ